MPLYVNMRRLRKTSRPRTTNAPPPPVVPRIAALGLEGSTNYKVFITYTISSDDGLTAVNATAL